MKATQKGLSIEGVQGHNRQVILKALHDLGTCSRKDISVVSGLDQATITRAIGSLLKDGIVEEVGLAKSDRGRRSINLDFTTKGRHILCLRLQRRSFSIAVFNLRGESIEPMEYTIQRGQSAAQTFADIAVAIDQRIADLGQVDGIGIAVPGPFLERDERVILITESPEWQGFEFIAELRSRNPDIPIFSTHDAKAAGLTEWRHVAHKTDARVLLYVSAGQGIGSALIVGGEIYRGALGLAGELGHMSINFDGVQCKCGNTGCLELYASRIVLMRAIRERAAKSNDTNLTGEATFAEVVEAYATGDELVTHEVSKVARYLAQGISNCINFSNPDLIVIGDEYAEFGEPFLNIIKKWVEKAVLPSVYSSIKIELSNSAEDTVLKGAFLEVFSQTYLGSRREPQQNKII
ncbi:ROK family transcriptional regulator [Maritalea sp.]|uniref:ROK family transcriptional regulator n=1 Tax=Maritalea sp. TaxID=2003361 RepID=UPI003EFAE926